ncbi:hypothetical protein CH276_02455 [Rhodococcus sp. 06-470-2]|nr:hypothetical protein CH276_02455 [Rhodococcus sp. 06-470-2]OZE59704.1 hypothetical protein CH265_20175 [Rhodococcus sp. 05-2221-1B]
MESFLSTDHQLRFTAIMQHGSDNRRWCGSVTDWARYWQPQDEENIRFAIPETVAVLRPSASAMRVAAADCDMCKVPVRPVSSALLVCVARTFDSPTRDCLRRARLHFIVRESPHPRLIRTDAELHVDCLKTST